MGRKRKSLENGLLPTDGVLDTPVGVYQSLKMYSWYNLPDNEKYKVVEDALNDCTPLKCIGRCKGDLPANTKQAVQHLTKCLLSKYYTYIGKTNEYRQLQRDDQLKLARDAVMGSCDAPCLNIQTLGCQMKYNHPNAVVYHANRCGLDPEQMPWECYRCGYLGNKAESAAHLEECKRKQKAEAERLLREQMELGNTNVDISKLMTELSMPKRESKRRGRPPKNSSVDGIKMELPDSDVQAAMNEEAKRILQSFGFDPSQSENSPSEQEDLQPSTSSAKRGVKRKTTGMRLPQRKTRVDTKSFIKRLGIEFSDTEPSQCETPAKKLGKHDGKFNKKLKEEIDEDYVPSCSEATIKTIATETLTSFDEEIMTTLNSSLVNKRGGRKSIASVAKGMAPKNIRVKDVDGQKRFKFKSTANSMVKPDLSNVRDYLRNNYESRYEFFMNEANSPICDALLTPRPTEFIRITEAHPLFTQWYSRSSIGLFINDKYPEVIQPNETNGFDDANEDNVKQLVSISLFDSKSFEFSFDQSRSLPIPESSQIVDIFANVLPEDSNKPTAEFPTVDELYHSLKASKLNQSKIQVLFCGGPISSLRVCPQRTKQGFECFAVSTFNDERFLVPPNTEETMSTYVQFWVFDANNFENLARPWFILEVPDCAAIIDMCWCPVFNTAYFSRRLPQHNGTSHSKGSKSSSANIASISSDEVLGILALSTSDGRVFIYRIPHDIEGVSMVPATSSKFLPPILSTDPLIVFGHPDSLVELPEKDEYMDRPFLKKTPKRKSNAVKTEEDEQNETLFNETEERHQIAMVSSIPIISLDWSLFDGGRYLAGASLAGKILVWDFEATRFEDQVMVIDIEGGSPPSCIVWTKSNEVGVALQDRVLRFYDTKTKTMVHEDDTVKTAGKMIASQPQLFDGLIVYETNHQSHGDMTMNIPSYYMRDLDHNLIISVPLANAHQVQCSKLRICEYTGLTVSVGSDGRLVYSLNGRTISRRQKEDFLFNPNRTHLHLVRSRLDVDEDSSEKLTPLITHDDCVERMVLELRVGDGALIEHHPDYKTKRKIPDAILDRRIESLTCVDLSRNSETPGLSISGGESGLVFIVPCYL